jgi:N-acetylglutamate synthase-like GNAT family acetyltransferase
MPSVRLLGPGDEAVLAALAHDDAAFEVAGRGRRRRPLGADAAAVYLADAHVLHWVAEADEGVVGHLLCYLERRRSDDAAQLLLYEIGVREDLRRRGIGSSLLAAMEEWMQDARVRSVWVLADGGDAEAFYAACGFSRADAQPVQMSRRLEER